MSNRMLYLLYERPYRTHPPSERFPLHLLAVAMPPTILVLVVIFSTQDTPRAPHPSSVAVATSPASRRLPELIHPTQCPIPYRSIQHTIATTSHTKHASLHTIIQHSLRTSIQAAPLQQRSDLPSLFEPAGEARFSDILSALLHFHEVVREYNQHPVPKSLVVRIQSHTKTPARSLSLTDYSYLYR